MLSLIMFLVFMALALINMPISMAMGLSGLLAIFLSGENIISLPQNLAMGVFSYPLMAVPFFVVAGNVMNSAGLTTRIFDFSRKLIGHLPGGLAQVNVLASMIFAGISGAAVADCAGLGTIQIKAMSDAGYSRPFSAAVTLASATIGPIIPPSLMLVIYAVESNASVAALFLAGVIPGVLMGLSLMIYIVYLAKSGKESCPTNPRASLREIWRALKNSFFAVISPGVILWCLVSGVVTPTETGVIATVYAVVVGLLYGDFKLRDLPKVLEESILLTALIMFVIAMATIMGHIMTLERTPQLISGFMLGLTENKFVLLILINVFLLFLGSILEGMPILIIMIPILLPLIQNLGVDVVHFGIIMCFNVVLGIITPPMAIGIVILVGISGVSFEAIAKASLKFLIPLIAALLVITFVPQLSLLLPELMLGG